MPRSALFVLIAVVIVAAAIVIVRVTSGRAARPAGVGTGDRLAACPASPNCVSSLAEDQAQRVAPLAAGDDPFLPYGKSELEAALGRARSALEASPRTELVAARDGYLHAEVRSLLFGFIDDVEILADPAAGVLQVRSSSRTGHSDLGVNRRRVEALRNDFQDRR